MGSYTETFAKRGDFMRIHAAMGDHPAASGLRSADFADLVTDSINLSNLTSLAARWRVPEQTLRGWRDRKSAPTLDYLVQINFNDNERLRLLRIIAGEKFVCTPNNDTAPSVGGIDEYRSRGIALMASFGAGVKQLDWYLADRKFDPDERAAWEAFLDDCSRQIHALRPIVVKRWWDCLSRAVSRITGVWL